MPDAAYVTPATPAGIPTAIATYAVPIAFLPVVVAAAYASAPAVPRPITAPTASSVGLLDSQSSSVIADATCGARSEANEHAPMNTVSTTHANRSFIENQA